LSNDPATVHFVGAGPGAPDLITLRGARLLREADVVVWAGSLVNPQLLEGCPAGCELHDSARMTLEEVFAVMRDAALAGRRVVRLHTGDPSIYGAIREQMDLLDAAGIPYDVTPGVSSMSGAAAALRCEYTLPGVTQSLVVTREAGRTPTPDRESLSSLAAHGTSMVVFLSAGLARRVQGDLVDSGRDPDEPAAIVYKATWPDERVVRCTVGTLAESAEGAGIDRLALIVVGDAVAPHAGHDRSRLYDPSFPTGYREAR
jgi:precorrin-4/cobalt-precorrin-4 C11-methyltransferase